MGQYPTKEEILSNEVIFNKNEIDIINFWKKTFYNGKWGKLSEHEKFYYLSKLIVKISNSYNKPIRAIYISRMAGYNPWIEAIFLNKPSITTSLHELAHHLNGENELEACRWSIWLFMKCFQKEYNNLTWDGHLLVKRKN
jgi:hypothetical protein